LSARARSSRGAPLAAQRLAGRPARAWRRKLGTL